MKNDEFVKIEQEKDIYTLYIKYVNDTKYSKLISSNLPFSTNLLKTLLENSYEQYITLENVLGNYGLLGLSDIFSNFIISIYRFVNKYDLPEVIFSIDGSVNICSESEENFEPINTCQFFVKENAEALNVLSDNFLAIATSLFINDELSEDEKELKDIAQKMNMAIETFSSLENQAADFKTMS